MGKLMALVGTTIGSGLGWWLGARVGMMTAFICSVVGTGIGLYVARRVVSTYFE